MAELLGREPKGRFRVVRRDAGGAPTVIRNEPLLDDGTPMPTLYWLVGREERRAVDHLEAAGGVRRAQGQLDPEEIRAAHLRYAAERDAALPAGWSGARPAGGVGGTREGVKCLHAHYAWYLAGGDDPVGRWVSRQLSPQPAAAIDCGTNSTRLLVGFPGGPSIDRRMRITRLGQGVDSSRRLAPDAIARTLDVLREYRQVIDDLGATRVRMTATSAARDALNREDFLGSAQAIVGVPAELLAGDEEGRLSFAGATGDLDPAGGPWLVADIGGGSTELVWGPGPDGGPLVVRSLDVGCVRLTERFLHSDPPEAHQIDAARRFVAGVIDTAVGQQPELARPARLVGLAGTVSCLAGLDLGLARYDHDLLHHHVLPVERVDDLLAALAATDAAGRRAMPGVEPQRADVIVGGSVVLSEVMHRLGFAVCLTSEADILDGLVASTAVT